jgi:hypothetical protein
MDYEEFDGVRTMLDGRLLLDGVERRRFRPDVLPFEPAAGTKVVALTLQCEKKNSSSSLRSEMTDEEDEDTLMLSQQTEEGEPSPAKEGEPSQACVESRTREAQVNWEFHPKYRSKNMRRRLIYRLFLALGLGLVTFSGVLAQVIPCNKSQPIHTNKSDELERVMVTVTVHCKDGATVTLRDKNRKTKELDVLESGWKKSATYALEKGDFIEVFCGGDKGGDGCTHDVIPVPPR